ncbi:MAG: cytochrome P450 [Dehalococcoidia bacterium]
MTTPSTNPSEAAPAPVMFNPFDPAFRKDPYSVYYRLRTEDPVQSGPFGRWILSRHADCLALLRDPRSSNDDRNSLEFQALASQQPEVADAANSGGQSFLFLDPPDHTRLRGLVSKAFTPRVVEALRPRIQEIVDGLLDQVDGKGEMEVIEDLAYPLPVQVISEMLGVPGEDHVVFKGWSRDLARALDPSPALDDAEIARRIAARDAFNDYFRRLIEHRRREPGSDLLSALIAVEEQGDTLTEAELLSTCILLLIAGHETTVNLIGNGLLALLRNPDQLALLRNDPSLGKSAVEELLRYDAPVQMTSRILLADYEIDGQVIGKGEQAVLLLASANRDPAEFEDPERLDLTRAENRHLAFGFGIHFCLGAPLARVEGQIALATLVRRFPHPELLTDDPEYKENIVLRGLAALPVRTGTV